MNSLPLSGNLPNPHIVGFTGLTLNLYTFSPCCDGEADACAGRYDA